MYKDSYKGKVKIVFVICTGMGRESPIESRVAQHRRAARAARDVDDAPGLQQKGVGGGGHSVSMASADSQQAAL